MKKRIQSNKSTKREKTLFLLSPSDETDRRLIEKKRLNKKRKTNFVFLRRATKSSKIQCLFKTDFFLFYSTTENHRRSNSKSKTRNFPYRKNASRRISRRKTKDKTKNRSFSQRIELKFFLSAKNALSKRPMKIFINFRGSKKRKSETKSSSVGSVFSSQKNGRKSVRFSAIKNQKLCQGETVQCVFTTPSRIVSIDV